MSSQISLRLAVLAFATSILAPDAIAAPLRPIAPQHLLTIDASARPSAAVGSAFSFRIHAGSDALDETTLRFREAARHIKTALSAHGLFEASDDAAADFIVELDYGLNPGAPKFQKRYAPIYSLDHKLHVPVADPNDPNGWAEIGRHPPDTLDDGSRLIGYSLVYLPIATTEKFLSITAHENQPVPEGRPPATLWHVAVSLDDTEKSLRSQLPLLAAAVMDAIGRDTKGAATHALGDQDSAVVFINKGL